MAFPAYKYMDIPELKVEDEESNSTQPSQPSGVFEIFSPSTSLFFNKTTISELLANLGLEVSSQRVDDIPVVLATLLKMDIPNQIDSCFVTHGNREGLSLGWLTTVWLVYMITQQDHRMNHVRDWVADRRDVLECLIEQPISETDFTDDRLADGLRYLSQLGCWNSFERELSRRTIRVYDLKPERVRLDATTASTYHDTNNSTLFKVGRTKSGNYNTQFKIMLGTLDPLGMPIGVDVAARKRDAAGNFSDDPLYLPVYWRIRETVGQSGLLYIGDCKMAALETLATIADNNDHYLTPLPQTGHNPELLAKQIERINSKEVELIDIYRQEDIPQEPNQKPDPLDRLAQAFEFSRSQTATINEKEINWNERVLVVRSDSYANSQIKLFERRLDRAEKKLLALTPQPKRGSRQYRELEPLQTKVDDILSRYKVADYFDITLNREEKSRQIRSYRGRPARLEIKVRYQLQITRKIEAIEVAKQSLGFRLYVTNQSETRLSISQAVLAYRQQHIEEQQFSRLKGSLGITPLYVQRDDHALGLIRLLTVALRAMGLFEFEGRRQLAEKNRKLSGIYAGNPHRATARPTAERMLDNFSNITLTTIYVAGQAVVRHLTPLTPTQKEILSLLHLRTSLYTDLAQLPALSIAGLLSLFATLPLSHSQPRHALS
ncbi:MAG: IS1634 family transposase [Ardenticatenaceae bacterium]